MAFSTNSFIINPFFFLLFDMPPTPRLGYGQREDSSIVRSCRFVLDAVVTCYPFNCSLYLLCFLPVGLSSMHSLSQPGIVLSNLSLFFQRCKGKWKLCSEPTFSFEILPKSGDSLILVSWIDLGQASLAGGLSILADPLAVAWWFGMDFAEEKWRFA